MKKKIIVIIAVSAVVVIYIAFRCIPNEKDRVKRDIVALEHAVEREDRNQVLRYVDPDYLDQHAMTYDGFVNNIDNLFLEAESISIVISGLKITIDSTNSKGVRFASCSLGLKVFARYEGTQALLFGGIIKPAPVKGWFKKTLQNYRVYSAEY